MQDAKEEVRARLNIEDVIGEYVQLKRAGRNFKGLSPFSGEKTPSFMVSPEKHIWHDFSSGKGGDVFSFVMQVEGMDFRQALEYLARKAGVDLGQYQSAKSGEFAKRKKRCFEANRLAAQYYQKSLLSNQHALEYVFKKRQLSKEVVGDFKIGYAPDSGSALVDFLTRKGFSKKEVAEAGLTNRFGGDLFRGRMMVPLMDGAGQVIGFTARVLKDEPNSPKYLNTPQTMLYDKSRHVFGLSQAKEAIRSSNQVVLVEGNLDVVSSHQVGIKQVVATAGTALTEHHLRALVRLSQNIKLAFDGDRAGVAATERAIPIAQEVGAELTIVSLPDSAKDPDELIKQDVALWQGAIEGAQPAVDWLLGHYEKNVDMNSASGKRQYTTAGIGLIRRLSDPVDQDHYIQLMARRSGSSVDALRQKLSGAAEPEPEARLKPVADSAKQLEPASKPHLDDLLALMLSWPDLRGHLGQQHVELFEGSDQKAVAAWLVGSSERVDKLPSDLQKYDTYVKILLLRAETRYGSWNKEDCSLEVARLLRIAITENNKHKRDKLIEKLRDAELEGDDALAVKLRGEINALIKEMRQ